MSLFKARKMMEVFKTIAWVMTDDEISEVAKLQLKVLARLESEIESEKKTKTK